MHHLIEQLTFARAVSLARSGDDAAAEILLRPGAELPAAPASLDLMARLRAQRGDYIAAEDLWRRVLKLAPSHAAAIAGIRRIRQRRTTSPWWSLLLPTAIVSAAWMITSAVKHHAERQEKTSQQLTATLADQGRSTAVTAQVLQITIARLDALTDQLHATAQTLTKDITETRQSIEKKTTMALTAVQDQSTAAAETTTQLQGSLTNLAKRLETIATDATRFENVGQTVNQIAASQKAQTASIEKLFSEQAKLGTEISTSAQSLTQRLASLEQKLAAIESALSTLHSAPAPKPPTGPAQP